MDRNEKNRLKIHFLDFYKFHIESIFIVEKCGNIDKGKVSNPNPTALCSFSARIFHAYIALFV